jgi:hypothetical protein
MTSVPSVLSLGSFSGVRTFKGDSEDGTQLEWVFECEALTLSGAGVRLTLQLCEELECNKEGGFSFQLSACDGSRVVSQKKTVSGGTSFVWIPSKREVKDIRVYVTKSYHKAGYGYLIVSFVKAFFFAYRTDSMPEGSFAMPLGGNRGVEALTVLPNTSPNFKFYRKQNFAPDKLKLRNKWVFWAHADPDAITLEPELLDHEATLSALLAISRRAPDDVDDDVAEESASSGPG